MNSVLDVEGFFSFARASYPTPFESGDRRSATVRRS
jgi:hypothetical protein